jgi:hypothetical protein
MTKLALAVAISAVTFFAAAGASALAFGPSPSDAHPPGALFESSPTGATSRGFRTMRSSNVSLAVHERRHHRSARPIR